MSFEFSSIVDQDNFKTFSSMLKYNNGFWKSSKQRDFLSKRLQFWGGTNETAKEIYNINIDHAADQEIVAVDAYIRWADYGRRSIRRCEWFFVLDEYGILAKYKLGFIYHGTSSSVDMKKTVLEWSRPVDIELPVFVTEPVSVPVSKSEFVGEVGKRVELRSLAMTLPGSGNYVVMFMNILANECYRYFANKWLRGK